MIDRHLSWENLQALIVSGAPARFPIQGEPRLEVMMEPGSAALSLLIFAEHVETLPVTALEAIQIERISLDQKSYVRIVTRVRPLYREFYLLLTEIADSVQIDQESLEVAVNSRLESWKELLRAISVLSDDTQLGLLGELWVLLRLIHAHGPSAVESWTGPAGEPHDFRYGNFDLEVKSTRNRHRAHVINGLEQLQASEGLGLYLLSLQFEPANTEDAITLPQQVDVIRSALGTHPQVQSLFDRRLLEGCGYRAADEQRYTSKYRFRSKPMIVAINNDCPKLTKQSVFQVAGKEAQRRISDVHYTLNVDDLGFLDGTQEFMNILP